MHRTEAEGLADSRSCTAGTAVGGGSRWCSGAAAAPATYLMYKFTLSVV